MDEDIGGFGCYDLHEKRKELIVQDSGNAGVFFGMLGFSSSFSSSSIKPRQNETTCYAFSFKQQDWMNEHHRHKREMFPHAKNSGVYIAS